jgi:hypothetical protein
MAGTADTATLESAIPDVRWWAAQSGAPPWLDPEVAAVPAVEDIPAVGDIPVVEDARVAAVGVAAATATVTIEQTNGLGAPSTEAVSGRPLPAALTLNDARST